MGWAKYKTDPNYWPAFRDSRRQVTFFGKGELADSASLGRFKTWESGCKKGWLDMNSKAVEHGQDYALEPDQLEAAASNASVFAVAALIEFCVTIGVS